MSQLLKEIKEQLELAQKEQKDKKLKRINLTTDFKKLVLKYHYESGRLLSSIAEELHIHQQYLYKWKKLYGNNRTAVIHGSKTRNDVRTKCLAVKSFHSGSKLDVLATEYNVKESTILAWAKQYKDKYLEYIDLPDGVTVIAKEERQIYGHENILEVERLLADNHQKLTDLLKNMHMTDTERKTVEKMKQKNEKKQENVKTVKELADELNLEIK